MTEQLITEIQRKMLPYLNNEQLMHLRDAMAETLEGATITYDSGSIPAEETDAVEAFITAKRIEGCSEKTLSYYRKTIESLIAGVGKAVQQVTTDDLRRYLTNYQVQRRSSKVTIDNIRRILSSFFSWLEDEDYIVKSPVRRIHKVKTAKVIKETLYERGGNLVVPAFSVGRTQEMLYFIRRIKSEHLLPEFENFEVYIDSPLAVEATSIFNKSVEECFDEDARALVQQGINPIGFPGLKMAITSDESKMINFNDNPKVIISASGMCEAGRIRHHLKHNLWRKDSTILFVGYQVPGTLGFSLLNGAKEVRLFGETIEVAARIENLPGISGHADVEQLTKWAAAFENKPKKVFVVHGEDKVTEQFADHLKDTLGYEAYAPFPGDAFDLATGEQVREGSRERAEKKITEKSRASSNVFARLLAAGQRLLTVINKCEGMPNKELGKFADQINALCNKWDR